MAVFGDFYILLISQHCRIISNLFHYELSAVGFHFCRKRRFPSESILAPPIRLLYLSTRQLINLFSRDGNCTRSNCLMRATRHYAFPLHFIGQGRICTSEARWTPVLQTGAFATLPPTRQILLIYLLTNLY